MLHLRENNQPCIKLPREGNATHMRAEVPSQKQDEAPKNSAIDKASQDIQNAAIVERETLGGAKGSQKRFWPGCANSAPGPFSFTPTTPGNLNRMQPFAPQSPEPVPPALEVCSTSDFLPDPSPIWLTQALQRFHSLASFDPRRSRLQRQFHRTQARIIRQKLTQRPQRPFNWRELCAEAFQNAQKPPGF